MATKELFPLRSEQPEGKGLKRILLQYTRYWYLFLLGGALALMIAFLYLRYYAIPQYSVYSTLLIKDDKSEAGLSSAEALNGLSAFRSARNIDNETQILNSQSLMTRAINELGLYSNYYVKGRVKDIELYGKASPIKVLISNTDSTAISQGFTVNLKADNTFDLDEYNGKSTIYKFGQQIRKPYGTFTVVASAAKIVAGTSIIVRFQDLQKVAEHYSQILTVRPINKDASVLLLSLVDPIPAKAKDVLSKLIDVYNKEAIEDRSLMATNTLKFLDERLQYLTAGLEGVEKVVEKYKSVNGLTDITTQASDYTAQASSYNTQLSEWAIQIDILESLETYLKNANRSNSTVPSTLGIKDETLMGLVTKFNELQLERDRILRTTEPGSIFIQNLDEQLANLRVNILENLRNIKRGLQITSNNLKANSGKFQSKIRKVPAMERELLEINRQQSIKQNIYSYLLQKREETALSLAATASTARVIDPAMGGDFPISPNGRSIYLVALLLGLGIPFAGIYARDLLNNKVQTQQDVMALISTPIIGEIARNRSNDNVVIKEGSHSPIAEMFRLVRSNIHFAAIGKQNLVLLVTSSMTGEGKTFFSINLGASLAITGKRVVLLDLDLRRPKVAADLKLPTGMGLTDYLVTSDGQINDIIRPSERVPGMFVVSAGAVPPNPAELMMSSKFTHFMHELKEQFDYVIIDTSPIGQVADAFALSPFVDFTIYLVRYNFTYKSQLNILKNMNKNQSLKYPLLVLNDATEISGANYGYGYGYGYEFDNKNKKVMRK